MKTVSRLFIFTASFLMFCNSVKAQADPGSEIRNLTVNLVSDLDLTNKILFINVWRSDDLDSRENNIEFLRVSNIYTQAKLKNGSAGVAFVNICLDPELYNWVVSTKKDETVSKYSLENSTEKYNSLARYFDGKPGSFVIGADGSTLAKDLNKDNCFNLFKSL